MTALYLFSAAAGLPLIAWFLLAGAEEGGGDDSGGIGGVMLRLLPLSTIAIALATFGVAGLVFTAADTAAATTAVVSAGAAAVAGALNSTVFAYLRRSESTTTVDDDRLTGLAGRVVLPVAAGHRGRITVSVGGQQIHLSAQSLPGDPDDELEVGAPVVVVEVTAGVATVTRLDPELT